MLEPILLKSGHVLVPGTPDWEPSKKLFKIMARELKQVDISLEGLDMKAIQSMDMGVLLKAFFQVAGSDAIEACIIECASRSTLNDLKIVPATFAPPDMRRDYLPVAWEVMKMALVPFFEDLLSSFSIPARGSPQSQG
jgi:hypothetical protein